MADTIIVIRGEANWAKVTGKAAPHRGLPKYDKGPSWSIDVTPDAASRALIKKTGIADKLKTPKGEKDTRAESFIQFRIHENRPDGQKNDPPKINDASGRPWGDELIGNGSIVDVKVKVKDYGDTQGAYLQAIRVLKHVEYEGADFAPLSPDDEFFAASAGDDGAPSPKGSTRTAPNPDDLDDDVPFDAGS